MSIRKTLFSALLLFFFLSCLSAQNTNSPFSRYGFGSLENPALGKGRAMGGIGYGLRDRTSINPMNPASYSSVDTMNFVFDFGVSASCYSFKENGVSQINPNGKLDYVTMKMPLKRYWGLALGIMPFSNVGYIFSKDGTVGFDDDVEYTQTYAGTGGLNTLFLGTGISLGKHLSLGANLKYVFGSLSYSSSIIYTNTDHNSEYPAENWYLGAPSLDFGIQYQMDLGKKSKAVVGASFTKSSTFTLDDIYNVMLVPNVDTVEATTHKTFELPDMIGLGLSYTYDNRLTIGMDFQKQAWSDSKFYGASDTLTDNTRLSLGVEYLPSIYATHYYQAIKYRLGMHYTDSYIKLSDGNLKEVGVSLGLGFPYQGQKSVLNLGFEVGKTITPNSSYLSERFYRVSLGISFNEMWFFKRKL
ncbi:MAG: hypothetical protein PHR38_09510 [Bacteroidales bacterium]|nr:hypothetical protein [Bacteroidales bacterium]MDD4712823.1 hypothetical protein [Bacteroidales bacterium]